MVPLPGFMPGMTPTTLLQRMKKNSVARNGKCFFQFLPMICLPTSFWTNSMPHSMTFANRPCGTSASLLLNANMITSSRMADAHSQKLYCVIPIMRSPTKGMEWNSETRWLISSGS